MELYALMKLLTHHLCDWRRFLILWLLPHQYRLAACHEGFIATVMPVKSYSSEQRSRQEGWPKQLTADQSAALLSWKSVWSWSLMITATPTPGLSVTWHVAYTGSRPTGATCCRVSVEHRRSLTADDLSTSECAAAVTITRDLHVISIADLNESLVELPFH